MGINLKELGWDDVKAADNPENESTPEDYEIELFFTKAGTGDTPFPTPHVHNGKQYYTMAEVAKILGVDKSQVARWNREPWKGAPCFTADIRTQDGRYLYEVERVEQLKAVYHPNWMRGGYEPSPTTSEPESLSHPAPHLSHPAPHLSHPAPHPDLPMPRTYNGKKYFGAEDVAKIIDVDRTTVLYWQKTGRFRADERAHDGRYLYLVERVEQLKQDYRPELNPPVTPAQHPDDGDDYFTKNTPEQIARINDDLAEAALRMFNKELPKADRRGFELDQGMELLFELGFGYGPRWRHPKSPNSIPTPRLIVSLGDDPNKPAYNAILTPTGRKNFKHSDRWEAQKTLTAGAKYLFHPQGLDAEVTLVVEGEIDCASILYAIKHGRRFGGNDYSIKQLKVDAVALGGARQFGDLLKRVRQFPYRQFVILFDNDDAGRTHAEELRQELADIGAVAVKKFFDDFIDPDDKQFFADKCKKIDANELLQRFDPIILRDVLGKIVASAKADFPQAKAEMESLKIYREEQSVSDGADISDRLIQGFRRRSNTDTSGAPATRGSSPELDEIKAAINRITPEQLEAAGYLQHSVNGGPKPNGYICPFCGSGTKVNKSGAMTVSVVGEATLMYCFSCGNGSNVLTFLAHVWNYPVPTTGKAYFELLKRAIDEFHLPFELPSSDAKPAVDTRLAALKAQNAIPADIQEQLDAWQRSNGEINPLLVQNIVDAVKFIRRFNAGNITAAVAQSDDTHRALGFCHFYGFLPLVNKFYAAFSDAKKTLKAAVKTAEQGLTKMPDDDERELEYVTVSDIKNYVRPYVSDNNKAHEQYKKDLQQKQAGDKRRREIEERDKNNPDRLTDAQRDYLFKTIAGNDDADNADRLEFLCGDRIRYLQTDDQWLTFSKTKGIWTFGSGSKSNVLMPFAIEMGKKLRDNTPTDVDEKEVKPVIDYWRHTKPVSLAFTHLKGHESIHITHKDLDTHKNLINCLNGVVDLQTGIFYPDVDPELLITKKCHANYLENGPDKESIDLWANFFFDIMPDEMTRVGLQMWLGYCTSGETREDKFLCWIGRGGNGKGTLSLNLLNVYGGYGTSLSRFALLKNNHTGDPDRATTSLNVLEGVRFAISEEMPLNGILDSSLVKQLAGGDNLPLRHQYGEFITVPNYAKINISGNYTPKIENTNDEGIKRRLINMPFTKIFENPDLTLKDRLLLPVNRDALFWLLCQWSKQYYRDGLVISPLMLKATQRHLNENDFLAEFIAENCERGKDKFVIGKDFFAALHREYPKEMQPFTNQDLIRIMTRDRGFKYANNESIRKMCFFGLGLLPPKPQNQDSNRNPFDGAEFISSADWVGPPN